MAIPPEFRDLVHLFHQDMLLVASTEEGLIANAIRGFTPAEREILKRYLEGLLAGDPPEEVLQAAWEEGGPDWFITDIRRFFTMICDTL